MGFRTKLDYSDNRQISQRERTSTVLSGGTTFGVPFSALTSGPDLSTSGVTESVLVALSTFSGNSTETIFTWYDSRMSLAEYTLSAITTTTSAETQTTGLVFTGDTNTIIDDNLVYLTYTGVSFSLQVDYIVDLGGVYTGTVSHDIIEFISASTLDYTDRTIWIDNTEITRTHKLIITKNPQVGYVWSCIDSEGNGEWQYNSSIGNSIWTAGTGSNSAVLGGTNGVAIGDYSIVAGNNSNAIGISTVVFGDNITGVLDNTVYVPNLIINTGGTSSRLGVNTYNPEYLIDVNSNNNESRLIIRDSLTGDDSPFKQVINSATTVNASQIGVIAGSDVCMTMGVIGKTLTPTASTVKLGTNADAFISACIESNNLNIINLPTGSGSNNIRMYAGTRPDLSVSDLHIQGDGSTRGYIGINNDNPIYNIDVVGSSNSRLYYDGASANGQLAVSASTGLPRFGIVSNSNSVGGAGVTATLSFGVRAWDDTMYNVYGKQGDAFIYAGVYTNGINIISNDGSAGSGDDYIRFYAGQNTGTNNGTNTADIHIQGTGATRGYVGINTNTPTQQLDVNGNGRFRVIGSSASAGALHYTADGSLTTNTSDERLKTNIQPLSNALDKIKNLRGVSYKWLENPTGDTRIGFIAQEVNQIVPELTFINMNSDEKYMGVHYDNVTALLVEAIKELSIGNTLNNSLFETQTIIAEDNNIDLNYNGTPETAIGGGIKVLHGKGVDNASELITDVNGDFITNTNFLPQGLVIPKYTPTSSNDVSGILGSITTDDEYLYVKCTNNWKRIKLEDF